MRLKDIMTPTVQTISPAESAMRAAEIMRDMDVGMLPVEDGDVLVGTLTDRDIAMRAATRDQSPGRIPVREILTPGIVGAREDDDLDYAIGLMEENQVRRVLVLDPTDHPVGIVSLGDIALRSRDESLTSEVLEEVSRSAA